MKPDTNELAECRECGKAIQACDRYCPHCGAEQWLVTWDWKEQPDWSGINALLKSYGVQIEEVDTESDWFAVRVVGLPNGSISSEITA